MMIETKQKVFVKFEKVCKYYLILYQVHPENLINSKIYRKFHRMLKYKNSKEIIPEYSIILLDRDARSC
jgi:hypothetical protein